MRRTLDERELPENCLNLSVKELDDNSRLCGSATWEIQKPRNQKRHSSSRGWSAELRLLEWWVDHQQILARTIVSHRFLENEQFNAFLGYLWYKRSETRG